MAITLPDWRTTRPRDPGSGTDAVVIATAADVPSTSANALAMLAEESSGLSAKRTTTFSISGRMMLLGRHQGCGGAADARDPELQPE